MTEDSATPEVSEAEVENLYKHSTEMEKSEDATPPSAALRLSPEVPGANLLNGLVNAAPFSEYLHYKARANCVHRSDQERIRRYSEEHPKLAKFCTVTDIIFRIIVVLAVLAIVGAIIAGIIIKTFYA